MVSDLNTDYEMSLFYPRYASNKDKIDLTHI